MNDEKKVNGTEKKEEVNVQPELDVQEKLTIKEIAVEETDKEQNMNDKKVSKKKNTWIQELRDWVVAILVAVVVALLVRNFVFTLVKVQGQSMEPTLQNADRLYVNRMFYTPEKGDVVIFVPETDPDHPYVKRVIATEGDTVYIDFSTGNVFVNGALIEEPYIKEATSLNGSYIRDLMSKGLYSPENPIVIEEDHIFVLGDNRNNSKDSRELGPVSIDEVLGGAVFRFWPMNKFGSVHQEATVFGE